MAIDILDVLLVAPPFPFVPSPAPPVAAPFDDGDGPVPLTQPLRKRVRGRSRLTVRVWGRSTFTVPVLPVLVVPPRPLPIPIPVREVVVQPAHWSPERTATRVLIEAWAGAVWSDGLPALRAAEDLALVLHGLPELAILREAGDVALEGKPGDRVEDLLAKSVRSGSLVLAQLTRQAIRRLLAQGPAAALAHRLFDQAEQHQLALALSAIRATAELLGRAQVRDQQRRVLVRHGVIVEAASPNLLQEVRNLPSEPPLMAPEAALDYFTGLVPALGIDPQRWGTDLRRKAFTLAVATDTELLERVKEIIRERIQSGASVSNAAADIRAVLDAAGVSPRNPQYTEMVFRTNFMDSLNFGGMAEMQDPDVRDTFPVWKYLGVRDGRQGPDHEPNFDKYFSNGVSFNEVRGPRVFNCRCTFQPIDKWDFETLKSQGARVER